MSDDLRAMEAMAPFYDLDHDEIVEDVDFYRDLARAAIPSGHDSAAIVDVGQFVLGRLHHVATVHKFVR